MSSENLRGVTSTAPRCVAVSGTWGGYINIFVAQRVMGRPPSAGVECKRDGGVVIVAKYNFSPYQKNPAKLIIKLTLKYKLPD